MFTVQLSSRLRTSLGYDPFYPSLDLGHFVLTRCWLQLTDECGAIIKELCGETTFAGFESLREEYLKREEAATLGHHARPSEKQS